MRVASPRDPAAALARVCGRALPGATPKATRARPSLQTWDPTIPGIITSGNFVAACVLPLDAASACVDTGTPTGAPAFDAEGDPRSALTPDVGPDEWGDL